MLMIPPARTHHRRPPRARTTMPAATLTLVGCEYNQNGYADLSFDRAIGIGALVGSAITISDPGGELNSTLAGTTGTLINPTTLRLTLAITGAPTTSTTQLFATAGTGIVATNDGGTWAGVTGEPVPFP